MRFHTRYTGLSAALSLVAASAALLACSGASDPAPSGPTSECTSDSQCREGFSCVDGSCVSSRTLDGGYPTPGPTPTPSPTPVADSGPPSPSPSPGGGCGITSSVPACESCIESSSCCALDEACASDPSCGQALTCAQACASDDSSCVESCLSTSGGQKLNAFLGCVQNACGACNSAPPPPSNQQQCETGAQVVCQCAALAGEPCTGSDQQNAVNNCLTNTDPGIACLAGYASSARTIDGCEAALNACPN